MYGYEGLEVRSRHQKYSVELKRQAVQDDLEGGLSQYQIIGLSISLTAAHSGGTRAMTKGRVTTWQERIDIVLYCLANGQHH
ncbi:hypothetical protein OIN60_07290 [Paenibacillus sp. P96]|uniref:Transposase n=1 Tax=Paenibacillus zeirhizosphaerae TaxID=2987519 RepID=A0ABT9FPC8_9BACL|nr:hypothetical protein [Paenibacillus sp. P96]MDP4096570.1 hypothetical protein [Paenibacillus sp. P96]